ncbi:MAG: phosphatidate cytidylyltransferase, partial [Armatimonadetes bacterium]|nr:phosphatidate cytidylyltransferase [Armatimonadota bacterium]
MLIHRVVTALVGIPIALGVIYLGGWWLTGLTVVLALAGLRELYRLVRARDQNAYTWIGYPLAVILMGAVGLSASRQTDAVFPVVEAVLLMTAMAVGGAWLVRADSPPPSGAGA